MSSQETKQAAKQPTYTTAGTLYDPNATVPLQPPTRRCRTQRFAPNFQTLGGADASSNPLALTSLTFKTSSPTTAGHLNISQYSPLQQNYDRAINPRSDYKLQAPPQHAMTPTMRSGNIAPGPASRNYAAAVKQGSPESPPQIRPGAYAEAVNRLDAGFGDGLSTRDSPSVTEDMLSGFKVAGLTNLASYPNGAQRAAMKVLARGRANKVSGQSAHSRLNGGPLPLTAGPPGHRHFNPSTFDATVKALATNGPSAPVKPQALNHLAPPLLTASLSTATHQLPDPPQISRSPTGKSAYSVLLDTSTAWDPILAPTPSPFPDYRDSAASSPEPAFHIDPVYQKWLLQESMRETLSQDPARKYYPNGLPHDFNAKAGLIDTDWPCHFDRYSPRTEDDTSKSHLQTNELFYSGTGGFGQEMALERHKQLSSQKKPGVIGGEREQAKKNEQRRLAVEQACAEDISTHSAHLLSMAFGSFNDCTYDGSVSNLIDRLSAMKAAAEEEAKAADPTAPYRPEKRMKNKKVNKGYGH